MYDSGCSYFGYNSVKKGVFEFYQFRRSKEHWSKFCLLRMILASDRHLYLVQENGTKYADFSLFLKSIRDSSCRNSMERFLSKVKCLGWYFVDLDCNEIVKIS